MLELPRRSLIVGAASLLAAPSIVRAESLMQIRGEKMIVYSPADRYFVLDDKKRVIPIREADAVLKWSRMFESDKRRVAVHDLPDGGFVSTVFLGLDHGFGQSDEPVVFESMHFDKDGHGGDMDRYCTWAEAERGHYEMLKRKLT